MKKLSKEDWQNLQSCRSFPYQGKKVASPLWVFGVVMAAILAAVVLLIFVPLFGRGNITLTAVFCVLLLTFVLGYPVKVLQIDAMKALTQYFRDEKGDFYKVQFTNVGSEHIQVEVPESVMELPESMKEAQEALQERDDILEQSYAEARSKALAYYYVKRFQKGKRDWNWFSGGEAKVRLLGRLTPLGKNRYLAVTDARTKRITIPKEYEVVFSNEERPCQYRNDEKGRSQTFQSKK